VIFLGNETNVHEKWQPMNTTMRIFW